MVSVDGADDVIGWFRFGKLGESVDLAPNDICRVRRDALFDAIELVRLTVRIIFDSLSLKSLLLPSYLSSGTSVIIGPELNGCVFKFKIGGVVVCTPGNTVTTLIILAVVVVLSVGIIRAIDGLLFRAVIKEN